jgi:hypothetical protein
VRQLQKLAGWRVSLAGAGIDPSWLTFQMSDVDDAAAATGGVADTTRYVVSGPDSSFAQSPLGPGLSPPRSLLLCQPSESKLSGV